jgi:formamidopyrimidine-DNA glycosylase
MPELAEVEHGRRIAEAVARGRVIRRLNCADDRIVFEGVAPSTVRRKLRGRTVEAVHRWGKQLWFELDRGPHPLFHFGMTGAFRVPSAKALELQAGIKDSGEWPPRFTKIHFHFEDGGELVMTNARRLGRIRLREDPMNEPPLSELGFDPLLAMPSAKEFAARLAARRTAVKNVLMDQGFSAGVGNWIADEVLYRGNSWRCGLRWGGSCARRWRWMRKRASSRRTGSFITVGARPKLRSPPAVKRSSSCN